MIKNAKFNLTNLADLYYKSVENNVIVRANKSLFHDVWDADIRNYIKKFGNSYGSTDIYCYYLCMDSGYIFLDDHATLVAELYHNKRLKAGTINILSIEEAIKTKIIPSMKPATLRKFIIEPILPICNRNIPHIADFTIAVGDFKYNKEHPFPRDVTLTSLDGQQRTVHSFVVAVVSPMIAAAITNTTMKENKIFNLCCSLELVDWFIESAYNSEFIFDEKIDHEDGLKLLGYLMIINPVVTITHLRDTLEI
ncbi:hypothetical protein F-liban_249 [Faustovirus]|nr:hypothetical protein F-liban_249 [Faustovirus]SME64926.1 Hypothetical protein FSTVST1_240 [Faustovirus ST1]